MENQPLAGQEPVFQTLEALSLRSIDELSRPFEEGGARSRSGAYFDLQQFLQTFFIFADKFTDSCCVGVAETVRRNTTLDQVRGLTVKAIAKQARSEAFDGLDRILDTYATAVASVDRSFALVVQAASERSITGGALRGALTGRAIGGFGGKGDFLAQSGGVIGALSEIAAKQELLQRADDLVDESTEIAIEKVGEYLREIPAALRAMIDHASTLCYGSDVDLAQQEATTARAVATAEQRCSVSRDDLCLIVSTAIAWDKKIAVANILRSSCAEKQTKAKWYGRIAFGIGALGFCSAITGQEVAASLSVGIGGVVAGLIANQRYVAAEDQRNEQVEDLPKVAVETASSVDNNLVGDCPRCGGLCPPDGLCDCGFDFSTGK